MNDTESAPTRQHEKSWSAELPATGALIGEGEGRGHLAVGPLSPAADPPSDQPALYVPDFFFRDPEPWRTATSWEAVSWDGPIRNPPALDIEWRQPDRTPWEGAFRDALRAFETGELDKLVPVVVAEGRDRSDSPRRSTRPARGFADRAVAHARSSIAAVTPYALWEGESGVAGVSPELLFRVRPGGVVETMALAGTVPLAAAESLLEDEKLRHEHELVVRFITEALGAFGPVQTEPMRVLRLSHIAHLATSITLAADSPPPFEALVSALHPTPALGGLPRADAVARLLELDAASGEGRGGFGAPFGIRFPDGTGFCVVAIRNITWRADTYRIAAGAGLVAGSVLETEWDELLRKIDSVRRVFDP